MTGDGPEEHDAGEVGSDDAPATQARGLLEQQLAEHVRAGTVLDLAPDDDVHHEEMDGWGPGRTVDAAFVREVLRGRHGDPDPHGVRLRGCRITGRLDLTGLSVSVPLALVDCYLPDGLDCEAARLARLDLTRTRIEAQTGRPFHADNVQIATELDLTGTAITGPADGSAVAMHLIDARVGGQLSLSGATLTGADADGNSLVADGLQTGSHVFLDEGFTTAGAIRLPGAHFAGQLKMSGATLAGADSDGDSLFADGLQTGSHVFLDNGFTAAGTIQFTGAHFAGQLKMSGATLTGTDKGGDNLVADGLHTDSHVFLDDGFTAAGTIRFLGAHVVGVLSMSGAKLTGADKDTDSLFAEGLRADSDVYLDDAFTADGTIRLARARLAGRLVMSGATLTGADTDGNSLVADVLQTGGDVFLDDGFTAAGAVRLSGAHLVGQLNMSRAKLTGTDGNGNSLVAEGLEASSDVVLDNGFTTIGAIRFSGAQLAGQLNMRSATLNGTDHDGDSLIADGLRAGSHVFLDYGFAAAGAVRLPGAHLTEQLSMSRASITGTDTGGNSLFAEGMQVDSAVFLDDGFTAAGTIRLHAAQLGGELRMNGATLTGTDSDGNSLVAEGLRSGSHVFLNEGFVAAGTIRLPGAHLAGQLNMRGATLTGTDTFGNCLVADGLEAGSHVFLDEGFSAFGTVRFLGAHLGGELSMTGATLTGNGGDSLFADGLHVESGVFLDDGFTAAGAIRLHGAHLVGELNMRGATLTGTDTFGNSLVADILQADSDVYLNSGFTAAGTVRMSGAHLTGQLNMSDATVTGTDSDGNSLMAQGLHADSDVLLDGFTATGPIRFSSARIGNLIVGADPTGLPPLGDVTGWQVHDMHGVVRTDRKASAAWLAEQTSAQPWQELAAVYDRNGQPADARWIRYRSAVSSTPQFRERPFVSAARHIYRYTTGHGYYPLAALAWLVVLFALALTFTATWSDDFNTALTPVIREDLTSRAAAGNIGLVGPPFPGRVPNALCGPGWDTGCLSAPYYALTTAVPAAASAQPWEPPAGYPTLIFSTLRLLAWVFTAVLLAGVTGLLRKQT